MTELLQEYGALQAERRPASVALRMGEESLSYEELEQQSNQLARLLQASGCRRGDRVCLFMPKSPRAIVAMLGTLKADCVYVPIDVASPAPRVRMIVDAADPSMVLVAEEARQLLDDVIAAGGRPPGLAVGTLETSSPAGEHFAPRFSATDLPSQDDGALPFRNSRGDAAHILFTSGSTGTPKGVVIKHENASHFVEWGARYFGYGADDRISGHPPLHFDLSTFDVYGALHSGAELHLVPSAANLLPQKLAELIRTAELTQWFSVPSVFSFMAKMNVIAHGDFPSLRRVLWCGEVLPTPILRHWMERLPHAKFTNLYGPTEATIASSYYTVPGIPESDTDDIPIGIACEGEELLVLDERHEPTPDGEIGDLYIAGPGLSPGYWRDEEKTAAAFVPDPRDPRARIYRTGDLAKVGHGGLVHFLGRADSQIKSRGYRIELGEIETALNALGTLSECAVVGVGTGGFEGTAICCAYATPNGNGVTPADLRGELAAKLPSYMLPSRWMTLDRLPKNVNGKIDRRELRERFAQKAAAA